MKLIDASSKVLSRCMGLSSEEKLLIVCDENTINIGESLFTAALPMGADAILIQIPATKISGGEPPDLVASALLNSDVAICPTTNSLTHSEAVKMAYKKGTRVATMPGITKEVLIRTMDADYDKIKIRSKRIAQILDQGIHVEVTTDKGTNISFSIKKRKPIADFGILTKKGSIGNLPAGEAFIAPLEYSVEGKAVIDGSITNIGKLNEEVILIIKGGSILNIRGGTEAEMLDELIRGHVEKAKMIGEFGIGTNDTAMISGNPIEDEKVLGTVHIAIGKNSSFGGVIDTDIHLDCIIKNPYVSIDGKQIMKNGKLKI